MSPSSSESEPTVRGPAAGQRVFGRYTLAGILGRGGMGVVWRARDETLGEDVALKFLPDAVRWDPAAFDDLKAETRRARQLTHPNIVRIHDFVEDAGGAAISMELVEGQTLTALRLARPHKVFNPAEVVPWLPQLCAALDYAHTQARVVHRDLKPANLMVTPGGVLKVADFGVARSLTDSFTRVSMMSAGTLVYMSPQQAMGEEPSPADDIYAVGATLYELLTGKPPFHTGDVRVQLFQRKPDSMAARRKSLAGGSVALPAISPEWEKMVSACLAKDAGARPVTTGELVACLTATAGAPALRRGVRRPTRREVLLGVLAVALALGGAAHSRDDLSDGDSRGSGIASPAVAIAAGPAKRSAQTAGFASDATRALAAWNFDGDGRDASGRGLDMESVQTTPTTDRFGRIDRALHFNGSAGLSLPDTSLLNWGGAQPFTATLWVCPAEEASEGGDLWHASGDIVESLYWGIGFAHGHFTATLARAHSGTFGDAVELIDHHAATAGEWHHVAMVSDGAECRLYVDGLIVAARALGRNRAAIPGRHVAMRFGRPTRLSSWAFTGDLDEARLWSRALMPGEVARLAERAAPPRYALTQGLYNDTDDFAAALQTEFGPSAILADWDDIKRRWADDPYAWAGEAGLRAMSESCYLQRGGQRRFDEKRHYFMTRFNGAKPDYFLAHDELGGAALTLGSWYGNRHPLLVALPPALPRSEDLLVGADGVIRREGGLGQGATAIAVTWRFALVPDPVRVLTAVLRLRDGRELHAVCRASPDTTRLILALGDPAATLHTRQTSVTYGAADFTLVIRDGELNFRAATVVGGNPIFSDRVPIVSFRVADIESLGVAAPKDSGLAGARLIVE